MSHDLEGCPTRWGAWRSSASIGGGRLFPLIVCLLLPCVFAAPARADADAPRLEYLYIDSSEGTSSGGHAAIRFGGEVFHFQHFEPGVLRSVKDDPHTFRYLYGFLENRTVQASRIQASRATADLLRDYFNQRYLVQQAQFDGLQAVREDQALLRLLLARTDGATAAHADRALRLETVGLFFDDRDSAQDGSAAAMVGQPDPALRRLRERIERRYGRGFLARRRAAVGVHLRTLTPAAYDPAALSIGRDRFVPVGDSFARRYKEGMTAMMALTVVQRALPLRAAIRAPAAARFRLSPEETARLARFRRRLESGLIQLVDSRRPDWGSALLIGMARLIAVDRSVRTGRLVVVDTFGSDDAVIEPEDIVRFDASMREQLADVEAEMAAARSGLMADDGLDEAAYARLEHWSNRFLELDGGIERRQPLRIHSGTLVPAASALRSDLVVPRLSRVQLQQALATATEFERAYSQRLTQLYRYNLFTRNCVSAIFRTIEEALAAHLDVDPDSAAGRERVQAESTARLGGYIGPAGIHFIPFVSAATVDRTYNVAASRVWPSYRMAQLDNAYRTDAGLLVYLRESNVISSTLYWPNAEDSLFLFFTDDAVLPRPLFGAINSAAALGQSLLGLFLAPFDGGRNLNSGARGVLFSLPELFFFNIRKGSYRYLPFARAAPED